MGQFPRYVKTHEGKQSHLAWDIEDLPTLIPWNTQVATISASLVSGVEKVASRVCPKSLRWQTHLMPKWAPRSRVLDGTRTHPPIFPHNKGWKASPTKSATIFCMYFVHFSTSFLGPLSCTISLFCAGSGKLMITWNKSPGDQVWLLVRTLKNWILSSDNQTTAWRLAK